ncbi:hypothetical protein BASA81_003854 [Batrachochytrium salamandrivorans]|nr:hypothetical protein BASA81_003854 [Batrachochytrium salamandrivorans]
MRSNVKVFRRPLDGEERPVVNAKPFAPTASPESSFSSTSTLSSASSSSTIRRQMPCRELLELAQTLSHKQQYPQAVEQLNKALKISPELATNVRFYLNRGSYLFKSGNCELALEDFNRAGELDGKMAWVHFNKGNVFKAMGGRAEEALRSFQRACELDPKLVDAHVQVSLMFLQLKRYQFALAAAQRALEIDANNLPALQAKLRGLVSLSRFTEAVDTIDLMIQCYQRNNSVKSRGGNGTGKLETTVPLPQRKMFARILMMACSHVVTGAGGDSRAIGMARHATELLPSFDTFSELGTQLMRMDRFSDAALMFHKATEFDPNKIEGFIMEGAALISAQQPEKALAPLKRAGRVEEGRREVRYYLGLAYFNLGRYLEAIPSLGRIVDDAVFAEDDEVVERARFLLSSCYIHAGEEQSAYELLKEARTSGRAGVDVLFQAGYVSSLVGKDEEAKECYEQVLKLDPKDARGICGLANLKEKHAKSPSAPPVPAGPPSGPPPPTIPKTTATTSSLVGKLLPKRPMPPSQQQRDANAKKSLDKPMQPAATQNGSKFSFVPFRKPSKPSNGGLAEVTKTINVGDKRWDCAECGCSNDLDLDECFGCQQPKKKPAIKPKPTLLAKPFSTKPLSPKALSPKKLPTPPMPPPPPLSPRRFALKPRPASSATPTMPVPSSAASTLKMPPPPIPASFAKHQSPPAPPKRLTPPTTPARAPLSPIAAPPLPPSRKISTAIPEPTKPPPPQPVIRSTSTSKLSIEVLKLISTLFADHEAEFIAMFQEEGLETMFDIEVLTLEDFEKLPGMRRAWARRIIKYIEGNVPLPVPTVRPTSVRPTTTLLSDITTGKGLRTPPPRPTPLPITTTNNNGNVDMMTRIKSFERSSLRAADLRPTPPPLASNSSVLNASGNNPSCLGMILDAMNSRRIVIEENESDEDMFEAEW